jgi:hypothetical protein
MKAVSAWTVDSAVKLRHPANRSRLLKGLAVVFMVGLATAG